MDIQYSVVIPIYNEFNSVLPLYNSLCAVIGSLQSPYEIIFVNDGSTEMDVAYLEKNIDKSTSRIINLSRHLGQTFALANGFKEAKGNFIFSMDGDLQDSPEYIPLFINKINQGFDVVCGYRIKRKDKINKIILSRLGNLIQEIFFRTKLHDISCTYRIYKRECIEDLKLIRNGYHRYIPFFLLRKGYKITEIPIEQKRRIYGSSKYNLVFKMIQITSGFFYLLSDILIRRI